MTLNDLEGGTHEAHFPANLDTFAHSDTDADAQSLC